METNKRIIGSHFYLVDEVDSTNRELLQHVEKYEHGSVLCAKKQSLGRGRYHREWKSDEGGLYFSFLLKDVVSLETIYPLVLLSSLAVVRSIASCSTHGIAIKWPNDIYINHRKVCGILAESSSMGSQHHAVIGIGVNVNNSVVHLENLRHPAVSLKECNNEKMDILELCKTIIDEINDLYLDFKSGKFPEHLHELNRLLYSKDQEIEMSTERGIRTIIPLGFSPEAKLICSENGKILKLFMGEF